MEATYITPGAGKVKAAVELVAALGGDPRTGMCICPAHPDHTPSLHVDLYKTARDGKPLLHCFARCEQSAVIDALLARGLWLVGSVVARPTMTPHRSDEERRQYALRNTLANRGRKLAQFLNDYFKRRGIERVPLTAMLFVPWHTDPHLGGRLIPDDPAMVFEVTNGTEPIGAHVTWLSPDLRTKRDEEPQRQFFGPISGGYIKLYAGDLEPTSKLVIAEGVESAMAAAQIAHGLPAIAALSANNLPKISPPAAAEYIIAGDNDANGAGQRAARALAHKLVRAGHLVRVAIPSRPNTDWNTLLMDEVT